ncbi:MAG: glycosyltransferase family 2 protein [Prolixibacteraceae bacterium]
MKADYEAEPSLVSILIPARNEEKNIEHCIKAILEQSYTNFELIVCDDQSQDQTAKIVQGFAKKDQRIQLIHTGELPGGWLGKNRTCHILSQHAKGEYYLFLDADVRINGDIIARCRSHSAREQLSLISIFPKQTMLSKAEKQTVPIMNYILLTLLPLILVRISSFTSLAAANGQFMFFKAADYQKIQAHKILRNNKVEDIAIARLLKKNNLKISCQTGYETVTCRMYTSYNEAVNGFARNIVAYFGGSFLLALLFWTFTTFGIFFIFWQLNLGFSLLALLIYLSIRLLVSLKSHDKIATNFSFIFQQQWAMAVILFYSRINFFKKQQIWKGRNIMS